MSAIKLFKAGYRDLVSVIPPGATLSENSAIKESNLGKVPGKRGDNGWYGYSFTKELPSLELAQRIDETGANVGMLGNSYPALDIDVSSAALSTFIENHALHKFGTAPVRLSREPRRLLVYRTDEQIAKTVLIVTHAGTSHLVEFLGYGRQYLVHGKHPTGVLYRWRNRPLWEVPTQKIPTVTKDQVRDFFDTLKHALEKRGFECELVGEKIASEAGAPPQDDLLAPSIDALTELVRKIPNDKPTRDEYIEFGCAIKAAGAEDEGEAYQVFFDWCCRWSGGVNDVEVVESDWERMHPPFRVGWSWLVEQAELAGVYNSAQQEFEADLDEAEPVAKTPPVAQSAQHVRFTDEWAVSQLLPDVRDKLRFVPGTSQGSWYIWKSYKWETDNRMQYETFIRGLLTKLSVRLEEIANGAPSKAEAQPYRMAAKRYQSADGINSIVRLLRARVACSPNDFDTDTMLLNTPGGVVDLNTGEVVEGEPSMLLARATTCAPADGEAPTWRRFVHDLTGGDAALIRFVQKMCGYALTGEISEKSLWFVWGSDSDTGKSTFIRALSLLFGDYADTVDVDAFVSARERIPADLARLPGVRLVTASESAAAQSWDERRIKAITGGDEISARFLYGQWFTYVPQFKIIIVGNHPPQIREVDDAMLRRIHIVPFNIKVPRDKQVENLAQKMIEQEGPQILHWLIEGCLLWQEEGLSPPDAVLHKTGEYVDEEDTVAQWLLEECEVEAGATASRQELYQAWAQWCRNRGEDPGGAKAFKHKIDGKKRKLKLEEVQVGERRLRGYRGICLRLRTEEGTEFETEQ